MKWSDLKQVVVLQPENPDGDSVASSLALEEILGDAGIDVTIYSYVHIPDYLHYIKGSDRITNEFPKSFDATIIVDTSTASLLQNTLKGEKLASIIKRPVFILDHHPVTSDLPLKHAEYFEVEKDVVATGEMIYYLAAQNNWPINQMAATHIIESILADSLGLNTEAVTAQTLRIVADMLDKGASMAEIDTRRRAYMKKKPEIIAYKGQLLQRIEYAHDGKLALVHIPWEEIEKYSPFYNPSMLALEELRNAENVELAVSFKTYPDGKITAKIRSQNKPLAGLLAAHFGGGGHEYAAGFKTMEWEFDELKTEVLKVAGALLNG
jgi:bifunctional oligoribonuclease and PAP phosphatase NrnA